MPLISWQSCLTFGVLLTSHVKAFTGSEYQLSYEYSGVNFFDGWDFYSGSDPTGGFVTYYSRSSAQLTNLIQTSEDGPAYMGVNYEDKLPIDNSTGSGDGAGRPSVRIASKQAFTHGLFIGDFEHIPAGICGTWPAFWTLGPNWPYTGEIDIMEGVNQNMNNVMSLHTNQTCTITGNASVMTGQLGNTDCAYYPDYNVGCGVTDQSTTSFGIGFNQAGGGVYAMQWTSESILIWHWARSDVPDDVDNKIPDPGSWGLPVAQLAVGNCTVDQHFQSHKIIFDTTFCGEYAGLASVWKTSDATSCADSTGLATCDNYVANHPEAFEDAYWSVNYVRVYQLVDPDEGATTASYIASEQPQGTPTGASTAATAIATPDLTTDSLCPQYNYSIISDGTYQYEIACDMDPPGPDLTGTPYQGFAAKSMADCIEGCTYINQNNGTYRCGGVSHFAEINYCYFKKYIDATPTYRPGYNEIRLIYYGYPQITDDPRSTADSTLTSVFVETIPTPQTYRPLTSTSGATVTSTTPDASSVATTTITIQPVPMGDNSTSTTSGVPSDYSETVTESLGSSSEDSSGTTGVVSSTSVTITKTLLSVSDSDTTISAVTYTATNVDDSDGSTSTGTQTLSSVDDSDGVTSTGTETPGSVSASNSITSTTSSVASAVTSTDPSATNAEFYVTFNVNTTTKRLVKRAVLYLAFDSDGHSILVNSEAEATKFYLSSDSVLKSGDQFVSVDTSVQPPQFLLENDEPSDPVSVNVDDNGNVSVSNVQGYCLQQDGSLTVDSEGGTTSDCQSVEPELLASPGSSSSTTTTTDTTSSTSMDETTATTSGSKDISTSKPLSTTPATTKMAGSETSTIPGGSSSKPSGSSGSSSGPATSSHSSTSSSGSVSVEDTNVSPSATTTSISALSSTARSTMNDFVYAGCFGIPAAAISQPGVSVPLLNDTMTNEKCTQYCRSLNAYYAATHEKQCLCGTDMSLYAALLNYPDSSCNTPCPGADDEICGGDVSIDSAVSTSSVVPNRFAKRQTELQLISLYNNTLLLPQSDDNAGLADTATSKPTATDDGTFPTNSISYNVTGTNTATVISTTYVDVCSDGLTTLATTITIPHCGCTATYDDAAQSNVAVPSPTVPMTTTVKACACGQQGAQSTIAVTIPCTQSISELAALVTQVVSDAASASPASAVAAQAQSVNQAAAASAGASASASASTSLDTSSTTPMHTEEASPSATNANAVDIINTAASSSAATAVTGATSYTANAATVSPAPAPASPPTNPEVSNTAEPATTSAVANGTLSNTPALVSYSTVSTPIASYTASSASRLLQSWIGNRYILSFVIGAFLAGVVSVW